MKIIVPDNWEQVTVDQFQRLPEDKNDLIEMIHVLSGCDKKEVEGFGNEDMANILKALLWVFEMPKEDFYKKEISINGKDYRLVNPSDYTVRDWVDLSFLIKDYKKNLPSILSVLYRHDGKRDDEEVFKGAMIGEVYGALVFFCHIESRFLKNTQTVLMTQATKKMTRKLRWTQRFRGMNLFTLSRKETF